MNWPKKGWFNNQKPDPLSSSVYDATIRWDWFIIPSESGPKNRWTLNMKIQNFSWMRYRWEAETKTPWKIKYEFLKMIWVNPYGVSEKVADKVLKMIESWKIKY